MVLATRALGIRYGRKATQLMSLRTVSMIARWSIVIYLDLHFFYGSFLHNISITTLTSLVICNTAYLTRIVRVMPEQCNGGRENRNTDISLSLSVVRGSKTLNQHSDVVYPLIVHL